jgi:hypothetical protein
MRSVPIAFTQPEKNTRPTQWSFSSLEEQVEIDDADLVENAFLIPVSLFVWLVSPHDLEIPEQCYRLSGRSRSSGF